MVTSNVDKEAPLKVLDIAAGHGVFGISIATRHPRAEIVSLDWPAVLDVASQNAREAGVADRLSLLPGDAYTFKELDRMFADAGSAQSELHRMEGPPQSVVVSTK